jgi:hypothetical protein
MYPHYFSQRHVSAVAMNQLQVDHFFLCKANHTISNAMLLLSTRYIRQKYAIKTYQTTSYSMESLPHTSYVQDRNSISMHKQRLYAVLFYYATIHIYQLPMTNMYRHNKVKKLLNYNFHISTSIDPILRRLEIWSNEEAKHS